MIRHVQKARVPLFVKVAHEVKIRMGCHVGGGHLDVLIPGNIHAGGIIGFVVFAGGDGEGGNRPLAMVHHGIHVRREHGEGVVVDGHRRVGPPQEGLGIIGGIEQSAPDLDIGLVGIQGHGSVAFGAVDAVGFADHHGGGAVRVFGEGIVHRHKGGGPVMLGPLNSMPPEIHGPARPTSAGLITRL